MQGAKAILVITTIVITTILTGCGENTAARDTAEAVIGTMFNDQPMLKNMPEYNSAIDCTANSLDQAGWGQAQHDFFMNETNQTGSIDQINRRKFSEAEQIEYFGPILMAAGTCMEQISR